jgi:hypothetical protein
VKLNLLNMKILKTSGVILFLFGCIFISSSVQAQDSNRRMGIKGGLNVTNLYVDDVNDENARFGFNLGLYGQILSSEVFAIQPELLFSTKGSRWDYTGAFNQSVTLNTNYLDLPVLAVIKLGKGAEIHVGPYAGYLVSANIKYEGDIANGTDNIDRDDLNTVDFGLAGGFGLNFGAMQVGARYNYGLSEVAKSNAAKSLIGDSKNSNAQLYVAFNLGGN